jgi:hypothetical protein
LYSSKTGGLKRWYNPPWFSETIPSMPYDPLVLRSAFESVNFIPCKLIGIRVSFDKLLSYLRYISNTKFVSIAYVLSAIRAGCDQKADD